MPTAKPTKSIDLGPAPGTGEALFKVLEDQRQIESKKDVLSFQSDLKGQEMEKANSLAQTLEGLRHQYRTQEAADTFNRAKMREDFTNTQLAGHLTSQIQSLMESGGGAPIPGFTQTTMPGPERAETEGAATSPISIAPGAAPAVQKDLSSYMGEQYKESINRQHEMLLQANPDQLTAAGKLSESLRATKDPQHAMVADLIDSAAVPGVHKDTLARLAQTGTLQLTAHQEKMSQLKATLEGASAKAVQIEKMRTDSAEKINQLRYGEGSLAQLKVASQSLHDLQAFHKGFDDDIKALITQRSQVFSKSEQAKIDAQIKVYTERRDRVSDQLEQSLGIINAAKSRAGATPADMQIRQLLERAAQNVGIKTRIPWNVGGTDQQAFESTLSPAEQKKVKEEYMRLRGGGK